MATCPVNDEFATSIASCGDDPACLPIRMIARSLLLFGVTDPAKEVTKDE